MHFEPILQGCQELPWDLEKQLIHLTEPRDRHLAHGCINEFHTSRGIHQNGEVRRWRDVLLFNDNGG